MDCREQYEWDAGRVEGAIHLPLNAIMAGAGSDLDASKPVVVICRTGNRSELATMMLQARGFEAYNLEGGIEAWARKGCPTRRPTARPAASPDVSSSTRRASADVRSRPPSTSWS